MENRKCFKCGETKLITEFYRDKTETGGRSYKCKVCSKKHNKVQKEKDPIKYASYWKRGQFRLYMRNSLFIYRYLRMYGKCVDCGHTDIRVLQFDHINRQDKSYEVGAMKTGSIKKIKKEIRKCEIRCSNCHKIKTGDQMGYMVNRKDLELDWRDLDKYYDYSCMTNFDNNQKIDLVS